MLARILWTIWALMPVAALAYHFGPGQRAYSEDRARDILEQAQQLEAAAETAQAAAYELHLAARKLRTSPTPSFAPAATAPAAREAAAKEDAAYQIAADAWKKTADKLREAQDLLVRCGSSKAGDIRIARDRAAIRGGGIADGVGDLENLLDELGDAGLAESALARQARQELATGYYYGALLMRVAGKPTHKWRAVSGYARQNFRYLAETRRGSALPAESDEFQKNLEVVLNLEQSGQEDLLARPLPKHSPRGGSEGLDGPPGRSKRPPRTRQDVRGAGGVGEIEGGW